MGYYTDYRITVKHGSVDMDKLKEEMDQESGYEFENEGGYIASSDCIKWYDWTPDMKKVSQKFPEVLIMVEGEGEESGDVWQCYFHNGRHEHIPGEVVFADSQLNKEFEAQEAIEKEILEK